MSRNTMVKSAYASIMVAVDVGPAAEDRVRLVGLLADRFSSHVIGIAAEDIPSPLYYEAGIGIGPGIVEIEERGAREELAKAESIFRAGIGMRNNIEWRQGIKRSIPFISEQSRAADLLVLGRQGPEDPSQGNLSVSPGALVMRCGRPILVTPPNKRSVSGETIVIAWKDTREARRAVCDSLPFLQEAERVLVVAVGDGADSSSASDVAAYLKRHQVACEPVVRGGVDSPEGVADEIVGLADDEGADLIVCGAYGHTRLDEWIFGGVTRHLLNRSPVPCLLSH
jgi:nucleotide-binding universal stress UspA family protein